MKRKIPSRLFLIPILLPIAAQTGCYAPANYPYGTGYGENSAYSGFNSDYSVQPYGSNDPAGYGQQAFGGQGYPENRDDSDDDDDENRYGTDYPWQGNPYGGYYGR